MKPDPFDHPVGDVFARQVNSLSAQLRDRGVLPARDLWPEIERAIDEAVAVSYTRPRRRSVNWLAATAALAATVLFLVGLGLDGRWPVPGAQRRPPLVTEAAPEAAPPAAPVAGPIATRQGLRTVEQALNELQTALERSPDDPTLSRLVLMIHHSRGRLLRLRADGGVREALRGRS